MNLAPLILVAIAVAVIVANGHHGPSNNRRHGRSVTPPHTTSPSPAPPRRRKPSVSLARMVGQMIIARFSGAAPSADFLARIRAGKVGGVILFAENVSGGLIQTRHLVDELQRAARRGGNPPLLVMTDQEGGGVKRLAGPPTLAPSSMTSEAVALQQGEATARLLRAGGIDVDLAPVADVERIPNSFLGTRAFGSTPSTVAALACSFAHGLSAGHVAYTLKHFPGLGRAASTTDIRPVAVDAPIADLRADYAAYRTCGANQLALVMISSASYPSLLGPLPAVMSTATYQRELPIATATSSTITISDDLEAPAITGQNAPGRHAINAGLDLLMYAKSERGSAEAYAALLAEARAGLIDRSRIRTAYQRIISLKRALPIPDSRH